MYKLQYREFDSGIGVWSAWSSRGLRERYASKVVAELNANTLANRARIDQEDLQFRVISAKARKSPMKNPSSKAEVRISKMSANMRHSFVQIFTPSGYIWETSWADPKPSTREALSAWREDTNSGKRMSKNWTRR